MKYCQ